jgi:uncharacterized protein with von Willebrand factor type A (vWA) domain
MLFGDFFFGLRRAGLDVSLSEWMGLMEALDRGCVESDLTDFYHVSRALLARSEGDYDVFDEVFQATFADGEAPRRVAEQILEWLEQPQDMRWPTAQELAQLDALGLDELRRVFEERLREQSERHDGGSRWIGTGGRSPFGHGGYNPAGVRVGGSGQQRSAVQIASKRSFRAYRKDRVLDTRSIAVALKRLRRLGRKVGELELDIDETVDKTAKNAGDLEIILRPPRKNQARVLLLMDVGGSMDPHARLVETLFSAAASLHHWRKFEAYSFHNCPYETLYPKRYGTDGIPTSKVLAETDPETLLIVVGDASMAPSELTERYGAIDYWHRNETPGLVWLHRFRKRFDRSIWLNPMPEAWWGGWTTQLIKQLYGMFPLTLAGLDDGIDTLLKRKQRRVPELPEHFLR